MNVFKGASICPSMALPQDLEIRVKACLAGFLDFSGFLKGLRWVSEAPQTDKI